MAVYQNEIGGSIGALLRKIQEERERMPHMVAPGAEAGAPMREMVTSPLQQVEAPETARVVSIRPEISPVAPGGAPQVVPPVAPVAGMPSVVPPVAPRAPSPGGAPAPSAPAPGISAPSLAPSARGVVAGAGMGMPRTRATGMATRAKGEPFDFSRFAGQEIRQAPRTTYGGQPILRTAAQAAPSLFKGLATRILPTIERMGGRVAAPLAAFGLAAGQLRRAPWLLQPGGMRARRG